MHEKAPDRMPRPQNTAGELVHVSHLLGPESRPFLESWQEVQNAATALSKQIPETGSSGTGIRSRVFEKLELSLLAIAELAGEPSAKQQPFQRRFGPQNPRDINFRRAQYSSVGMFENIFQRQPISAYETNPEHIELRRLYFQEIASSYLGSIDYNLKYSIKATTALARVLDGCHRIFTDYGSESKNPLEGVAKLKQELVQKGGITDPEAYDNKAPGHSLPGALERAWEKMEVQPLPDPKLF